MSDPGYEILSLDDLDRVPHRGSGQVLRPLRRRLGFRAFGVNVWSAGAQGDKLIPPHQEDSGHEELYVVVRGRALHARRGDVRRAGRHARPRAAGNVPHGDRRRARDDGPRRWREGR